MSPQTLNPGPQAEGGKATPKYIRRSIFPMSLDDPEFAEHAFTSWADAIVIDAARRPGRDWQDDIRSRMPTAIQAVTKGRAEAFVRVACDTLEANLDAVVFPGLSGVVLTGAEGARDTDFAARCLSALETSRGITAGTLEIDVEVDRPAAVWNALEIARASGRFGVFLVNEAELCRRLGMQADAVLDFDPLEFIKSQLITVATSVGGMAVGMSYPLGLTQADAGIDAVKKAVRRARDTGFKGAVCPHASWIALCNEGFQPTAEESAYYRKVIEVFAEGLRRGMASVPLDGKMIDVPVDVRAKRYLDWSERARARDDEKAVAHSRPGAAQSRRIERRVRSRDRRA